MFGLSDEVRAALEPHPPHGQLGTSCIIDRRFISGILRMLKVGCRWREVPPECGPAKIISN
ncbi:transposase [Nitratireductor indicus]|uniref:transposase n=1 Tax=Nitratireductor indicus TaxID=721133 RepID=UPI0035C7C493